MTIILAARSSQRRPGRHSAVRLRSPGGEPGGAHDRELAELPKPANRVLRGPRRRHDGKGSRAAGRRVGGMAWFRPVGVHPHPHPSPQHRRHLAADNSRYRPTTRAADSSVVKPRSRTRLMMVSCRNRLLPGEAGRVPNRHAAACGAAKKPPSAPHFLFNQALVAGSVVPASAASSRPAFPAITTSRPRTTSRHRRVPRLSARVARNRRARLAEPGRRASAGRERPSRSFETDRAARSCRTFVRRPPSSTTPDAPGPLEELQQRSGRAYTMINGGHVRRVDRHGPMVTNKHGDTYAAYDACGEAAGLWLADAAA